MMCMFIEGCYSLLKIVEADAKVKVATVQE